MRAIPVAIPLAWTASPAFFLQARRFCVENGSDCLRHWGLIR
jgi:hypothetical protein